MNNRDEFEIPPVIEGTDYDHEMIQTIENKWRSFWYGSNVFRTPDPKRGQKTFYCLDMFPYPSGYGLHVGHPVGYMASDIVSRYKRMCGFNVLHPMGWDAFGLPTERYAIKTGALPTETTKRNAENFKKQMNLMGLSFDWSRELSTTDPDYYQWTQLIFLRLYNAWFDTNQQKARPIEELPIPVDVVRQGELAIEAYKNQFRLVYYADSVVNWCPELNTVVANEEVMSDGRTEHGYEVVRKPMRQVMMRITAYSERLLAGLEKLEWPDSIKEQQRNWIGKTVGVEAKFCNKLDDFELTVFTTRPDTIFGVTFMVIAPEHEILKSIVKTEYQQAVSEYIQRTAQLGELARKQSSEKSGVFTGSYVQNPLTHEAIPIFVADYVLMNYGTGVVMGVPAHDQRDFDFAKKYKLQIKPVFAPLEDDQRQQVLAGEIPWVSDAPALDLDGEVFRTLALKGESTGSVAQKVTEYLKSIGAGHVVQNYRMRDWVFARQRYWGEPIPLIHWEDGTTSSLPEEELPLILPLLSDYKPVGEGLSALARAEDWVNVVDPKTGKKGKREISTMPQWAGSCWYPLRFMDPHNGKWIVDPEIEELWGPVDLYIGGAEHATLHLLYSRFWYLAMYDLGMIKTEEPFHKLVNQGMLTGYAYQNQRGIYIPIDDIEERKDGNYYVKPGTEFYNNETADVPLEKVKAKMSKSLRNVVNPDDVIAQYGADIFRIALMFLAPVENGREWETKNVVSGQRFLKNFWAFITGGNPKGYRQVISEANEDWAVSYSVNVALKGIVEDIENLKLNTAISKIMICLYEISKHEVSLSTLKKMVLILAPFAPFVSEELWQRLGQPTSITFASWPVLDKDILAKALNVSIPITVNGKKRGLLEDIDPMISDADLKKIAVQKLSSTNWAMSVNDEMIIIRDQNKGAPKLINVVKK
jgi:leucyl-tRNA synthetase